MLSTQPDPLDAASFETMALSQYIARQEIPLYAQTVADVFGFHALQIGWPQHDLLEHSRMPYKHSLQLTASGGASLLCESEFLPFAEQSVDLVCMPHVLEQCADPQQTLREAFRVLVPEGTLILTSITPLSALGLRARVGGFKQAGQFKRLFTAWRIRDWLNVLGFEVVYRDSLVHALPVNDPLWLARQSCLERLGQHSLGLTGGVYFLVAKKRVLNMRLLKPEWKKTSLNHALQVRKGQSSIQKQAQKELECANVESTMDRNVR
ncbi:class I SAM-dependent methyltransferase [Methylophilus medardicus]|uniref:Methyltransferase domain-containing protein n=1 Tax=Methylophilus medardicus TaxID=2588534 RepID=A0A5B8CS45_9PROT|nr:class I SAM-dependent methyltransferase [Methylophilus medardicus]QDC44122.1 methyltransferase domain-containing protein [Methylophilus medardicus]QDC49129.1 methyltransferase domain-containing protein [Methylophilus medardicus]QDC52834.1 methyltransferase domain-containing protein [Methylophilus medardicus]